METRKNIPAEYQLDGYNCAQPLIVDWHHYHLQAFKQKATDIKVHISLNTDDAATFKKACHTIAAHLTKGKYPVYSFKIAWEIGGQPLYNCIGKEVTVYMRIDADNPKLVHETQPDYWLTLFTNIENDLLSADIKPNPNPQANVGDQLFPGSKGFIHYRNAYNIVGRYVNAHVLAFSGFTRQEAFTIGPDVFKKFFQGKGLHQQSLSISEEKTASIDKTSTMITDSHKEIPPSIKTSRSTIFSHYTNNLQRYPYLQHDRVRIQQILRGNQFTRIADDQYEPVVEFFIKMLKLLPYNGSAADSQAVKFKESHVKQLEELCGVYLIQAATQLAYVWEELERKYPTRPEHIGNIMPAIYHYLVKPAVIAWKKDTRQPIADIVVHAELLENIVKASLRKEVQVTFSGQHNNQFAVQFAQIHFDQPQYIFDLTAAEVTKHYQTACALTPAYVTEMPKYPELSLATVCGVERLEPAETTAYGDALRGDQLTFKTGGTTVSVVTEDEQLMKKLKTS